jgi:SAM-dependent methyltransferase
MDFINRCLRNKWPEPEKSGSEMDSTQQQLVEGYNAKYRTPNYFRDRSWLYRPFIKALIAKAKLKRDARILDAGCGQGFFTNLFAENGLEAVGVDLSEVGISFARKKYKDSGAQFEWGDIRQLPYGDKFDCVFTRSCSLYNVRSIDKEHHITDALFRYVRKNGILIFDYYTKLNAAKPSPDWIYHSVSNIQNHFSRYPSAKVYFSLRLEAFVLGRLSFTRLNSCLCEYVSRLSAAGGEVVALVRKDV